MTITRELPEWRAVAHVDPPAPDEKNNLRQLFFYVGPNLYPAGLYMAEGYDLEERDGEDGWRIVRARDTASGQVMTQWAMEPLQWGTDEDDPETFGKVIVDRPIQMEGEA